MLWVAWGCLELPEAWAALDCSAGKLALLGAAWGCLECLPGCLGLPGLPGLPGAFWLLWVASGCLLGNLGLGADWGCFLGRIRLLLGALPGVALVFSWLDDWRELLGASAALAA